MPTLGGQLVRSPAFTVDLCGRDAAAFVCEVEAEAVKIVGKYATKTETLRSWDIHSSNVRFNRMFELNNLSYGSYPEGDSGDTADRRGKQVRSSADEGPSRDKAPGAALRKRKLGTVDEKSGLRATSCFVEELLETCTAPEGLMSSPELRETSLRMLKVTGGRWPRNDLIPRATGEDFFTSRLAHELMIFPYGRNIGVVVSVVMEKDCQEAQWKKRRPPVRLVDPCRKVKLARPSAKAVALGAAMPPPAVPRPPSPPRVVETAVAGSGGVAMGLSVDDYLVGRVNMFDAQTGLLPSGELFCFFVG
jgi:hypothetical protein